MTATVNFEAPQVQLGDGTTGIEISPIIIPYSIRNNEDPLQYLGGQVVLTKEDDVAFSDNTADWYNKALVKIKKMVASTELYTPEVETPDIDEEMVNNEVKQDANTPDVTTDAATPDNASETNVTPAVQ